jgi:hypothetical protein
MSRLTEREQLVLRVIARARIPLAEERERLEGDLGAFVEAAWSSIDSSQYQSSWCTDALCEHLTAVADGQIERLLVNYPPRAAKTSITSICFPAWIWAQRERSYLAGPQVRVLAGSYNHELSLANSNMTRRLMLSPWYQRLWGKRFTLRADMNTKGVFENSENGSRRAISVGGSLLGIGGDIIIIDDPHNTAQAESEAERSTALNWWKEISSTRLNDPTRTAITVIMQRLHEADVSGEILSSESAGDWTHLMIPARYEWRRHCYTSLKWNDPRGCDANGESLVAFDAEGVRYPRDAAAEVELEKREGALFWPERFDDRALKRIESELGPYLSSGRLAQRPSPAKGGVFDRAWWEVWEDPKGKFPVLEYIIASLDSAFTTKEANDPSALTVWGVFSLEEGRTHTGVMGTKIIDPNPKKKRRIILVHAWRKHLQFSGPRIERWPNETRLAYKQRTQHTWGLLEHVEDTCVRFKVHKLLIESKASGISAAQELRNRYGWQPCNS